mmetsp:Transcript_37809/g.94775  ORF Transcript_37809/g.94775 Transcript_37809/m.94775 type:complete len:215 (+) Transcript_37809:477-1121(+)
MIAPQTGTAVGRCGNQILRLRAEPNAQHVCAVGVDFLHGIESVWQVPPDKQGALVVGRGRQPPVGRQRHGLDGHGLVWREHLADAIGTEVPDLHAALLVAQQHLCLVGMQRRPVDRHRRAGRGGHGGRGGALVVERELVAGAAAVPDLDAAVLAGREEPAAGLLEPDARNVAGVSVHGADGRVAGGGKVEELHEGVAGAEHLGLVRGDLQAVDV